MRSILGPLLFLLFINDIVNDIDSNIRLFADGTSLFIIVDNAPYAAACLNFDLDRITRWTATWLVTFNPSKREALLLSRKLNDIHHPTLYMKSQNMVITYWIIAHRQKNMNLTKYRMKPSE